MTYCPEIALLHGTFALIDNEAQTGKYTLQDPCKNHRSSRSFVLLRDILREIVRGPEHPHTIQEQQEWNQRLHNILFCKSFIFNKKSCSEDSSHEHAGKSALALKASCIPIPDFHPHLYFEVMEEFGWAHFLLEMLSSVSLRTAQDFLSSCYQFCDQKPALLFDLHLVSISLNFLLSCTFKALTEGYLEDGPGMEVAEIKGKEQSDTLQLGQTRRRAFNKKDQWSSSASCTEPDLKCDLGDSESVKGEPTQNGFDPIGGEGSKNVQEVCENAGQQVYEKSVHFYQDEHHIFTEFMDLLLRFLRLMTERLSTSLFDRNSCRKGDVSHAIHFLNQILSSVAVFSTVSLSNLRCDDLRNRLLDFVSEEKKYGDPSDDVSNFDFPESPGMTWYADCSPAPTLTPKPQETKVPKHNFFSSFPDAVADLFRSTEVRSACVACLSSFFSLPAKMIPSLMRASKARAIKFGQAMKLIFELSTSKTFLRTLKVLKVLMTMLETIKPGALVGLQGSVETADPPSDAGGKATETLDTREPGWAQPKPGELLARAERDGVDMKIVGLLECLSELIVQVAGRERAAEQRRLNPVLTEVVDAVKNRKPGWQWCLEYGLAKKELNRWWLVGFLAFLQENPSTLTKASQLIRLMEVMSQIKKDSSVRDKDTYLQSFSKLVQTVFLQISATSQDNILQEVYKDARFQALNLIPDFEQAMTITFNKLSAGSDAKDFCSTLQLALHDPLTFTQHLVNAAITSQGQISVVLQVLQLMPGLLKLHHPVHHPEVSLLCHCLQDSLLLHPIAEVHQKNLLKLLSSLLQVWRNGEAIHPPLLSPTEFLSMSIIPFISMETPDTPDSIQFTLKLLIGCLEATLPDALIEQSPNSSQCSLTTKPDSPDTVKGASTKRSRRHSESSDTSSEFAKSKSTSVSRQSRVSETPDASSEFSKSITRSSRLSQASDASLQFPKLKSASISGLYRRSETPGMSSEFAKSKPFSRASRSTECRSNAENRVEQVESEEVWSETANPVVIVGCCASVLQRCMEPDGGAEGLEGARRLKYLALRVLELMQLHFAAAGKWFDASSVCWLQEKCAAFHWTVCAHLAWFLQPPPLVPASKDQLLSAFSTEIVRRGKFSPLALMQLAVTSDKAAVLLTEELKQPLGFIIQEPVILAPLSQLFPHLLLSEVKRLVSVLMVLLCNDLVTVQWKPLPVDTLLTKPIEGGNEMLTSQLLVDALILVAWHQPTFPSSVLQHVSQVFVAALQFILQSASSKAFSHQLDACVFFHLCNALSAIPEEMQDPLFVVLLDVTSRLVETGPSRDHQNKKELLDSLLKGAGHIPREALRDTLKQKLMLV